MNFLKKTSQSSSLKGSNFEGEQYLYLTTLGKKTGLPRQIEIWFTAHQGRFYVIAEHATSKWVQNVEAHPEAEVRIHEQKFPVRARAISSATEAELHQTVAKLSQDKYGWSEGLIIELTPKL